MQLTSMNSAILPNGRARHSQNWRTNRFAPQLTGMPYHAGKDTSDNLVRTKYLTELNILITGLTPTTTQGRLFGAIKVSSLDGKPLESIGTGFTNADAEKIWERHIATPGKIQIAIVCQGFAEANQIWHSLLSESFS
jgi:hypothetical protein